MFLLFRLSLLCRLFRLFQCRLLHLLCLLCRYYLLIRCRLYFQCCLYFRLIQCRLLRPLRQLSLCYQLGLWNQLSLLHRLRPCCLLHQ